ncbi:hypothetical protein F384_12580 [Citrobacter amalonaticus Y19]|uniref:Protoporphyrinogen IX oxidase n=1 Tax=Citrobacter amalonaticus Y19 TaxID=1261127 RepID=A0A0F6TVF1_CITAM|nr:CopD family protein [Citrobacter amalonaticus]AKE59366.1 hypothetical protein F384_12580 [Citrobacter amalonaticus Y19]
MNFHPWINAFHIAAGVIWTGGVLAMAVLSACVSSSSGNYAGNMQQTLAGFIHRWNRKVTTPAMIILWGCGVVMLVSHGALPHAWLLLKIIAVLAMSALHGILSSGIRKMVNGEQPSHKLGMAGYKVVIILTVIIIFLAELRP